MRKKKCDKDCLNCKLPKCIHDIEDECIMRKQKVDEVQKGKERIRHAKYYKENKAEIDAKQKEYDRKYRTAERSHAFYIKHKADINQKNRERYAKNREERKAKALAHYYANKDEISAGRKERYRKKKDAMRSI